MRPRTIFRQIFFTVLVICGAELTQAYPQYALNTGTNRCTSCHFSPVGGGVRHMAGKYYAFRNFKPSKYGEQDLLSADVRALFYYPEKAAATKGGAGVMAANFAVKIPLTSQSEPDTNFVYEHNLGGFPAGQGGPRDTYVRWTSYSETEYHLAPQHFMAGRFRSPFGLQTDEHRTLTKIQTLSSWNDFDMGAMASGDFGPSLHYDVAVANGTKTAGRGLGAGVATLWGGITNLRWSPINWPLLLGVSANYYEAASAKDSPQAASVYGVFSLQRATAHYVPATISLEYVASENWNSLITAFFADSAYQTSLRNTRAEAWWAQFNYDVTPLLTLTYKYDVFTPDRDFVADYYERHGIGFRYRQSAHLSILGRTEFAQATHPSEAAGTGVGAQDATWFVLQMNL